MTGLTQLETSTPSIAATKPAEESIDLSNNDTTILVFPDGIGGSPSLTVANAAARPGAILLLKAKIYKLDAGVEIEKEVTLLGAGIDETIITSKAKDYVIRVSGSEHFKAEDITFRHGGDSDADVVLV